MYRVAEFARIAGVSVRTLQYYDRIGLLKPAEVTESGHRLYERDDLLRLQQIVTLKWMGFPLKEIAPILDDPAYDLAKSLRAQKAAVDAEIKRLHEASDALGRALAMVEEAGEDALDADTAEAIIRGVAGPNVSWARQYYDEAAWAGIHLRGMSIGPEGIVQAERDWRALYDEARDHRDEPPDSPALQGVAAGMYTLIQAFTGGDPAVEAGLERFSADVAADALPPDFSGPTAREHVGDDDLWRLMQIALTIYRERKNKGSTVERVKSN